MKTLSRWSCKVCLPSNALRTQSIFPFRFGFQSFQVPVKLGCISFFFLKFSLLFELEFHIHVYFIQSCICFKDRGGHAGLSGLRARKLCPPTASPLFAESNLDNLPSWFNFKTYINLTYFKTSILLKLTLRQISI